MERPTIRGDSLTTLPAITVTAEQAGDFGPVRGYVAEEAGIGTKTQTSILETPQSVSVITQQQIEVQQPSSTSQALRYTAGANSERFGGFGGQLDITRIRGIDADYYLDGLRVISNVSTWSTQVDPFTLERIEILRGPSSFLYGQGTGGGVVNQVSRRPQRDSFHELFIQGGTFNRREIGFDSTGSLNDEGTLLYRFTGTGLDSHGQVEDVRHKRVYLAPALTWRPDENTSWTLLATYSREPDIPNYNSLPAVALGLNGSPFTEVDRRRNFSDMDFQGSSRKQKSVSSLFEHTFGNGWKLNSNLRYMYINSDIQRTSIYGFQNRDGNLWLEGTYGLAPSSSHTFQVDNNLSGMFELGSTYHLVLGGIDYAKGRIRNDSYRMDPVAFNPFDPTKYRPHAIPDFTDSQTNWPYNVRQDFNRIGLYLQDQISYDKWRLTLSARHDWSKLDDESRSYSTKWTKTHQSTKKWSGRAGLNYIFDNGVAPYISYATSFDPVLGNDFHGRAFIPTEAKQAEFGIKYQPPGSATLLSASVFQLDQTNVKTSDTQHLGFWTQSGKVRSRGLELQAASEIVHDLNLLANYVYLDNTLVKDATYEGKSLTQTPRHSASAWLDYRLASGPLEGVQLGMGVRYLGSTWGNPANTFKVPAATLVDLAASYDLGLLSSSLDDAVLSINVTNLGNKKYVASCTSDMYCFIGQDRVVTATLSYRW
ncbi:TonB-dependent siderophore receptor [Thiorhodococcus drewsii AZ1]|uniref:TonB-dependent siderophore receptor n=2 Tax=Thiorhodococcus drewsii TaxID=210408 RepID=G2E187_9GAMM|nr:TonB-dependent siderophore receptor [Thiorhodococcus drewsii AZ1]